MDRPVRAEVMLILERYEISSAAYHGGDLNGVSARRLMKFSTDIFTEIENYLLTYLHDDRCSDDYIKQVCSTYSSILSTLDVVTKNLRIISGKANENNYKALETAFIALRNSWEAANLSHTPKLHSLITHALPQMRMFGGIGDILEDDVEKMHQIAGRSESRVARLKSATNRALAEAKIEAISKNCQVKQHVERSKQVAKRKFSDQEARLSVADKKKSLKSERDHKQLQTVTALYENPLPKIVNDKLKVDFINDLRNDTTGS